jgi:hypothetical protein
MELPLRRDTRATLLMVLVACALVAPTSAVAAVPVIGGALQTYGVAPFDNSSPRQLPQLRLDLHVEQSIARRFHWRFSLIGLWGGPREDPSGPGVIDLGHSYQNVSPSLEFDEAYVDYFGEQLDLRVGKQRFAWGRLDGVQPNDQLNPRRYDDPFLLDESDSKVAVPAFAASYFFPPAWRSHLPEESRLTLVWEPIAVPWLFPLDEERWFPPVAASLGDFTVPATDGLPCPCQVHVDSRLRSSSPPARRFDNGNLGFRVSARSGPLDWALVYFDGFDPTPNFDVPIRLDVKMGDLATPVPVTAFTELRPSYQRYRAIGADGALPLGAATIRAEAAWKFRRPYSFALKELKDDVLDEVARDPNGRLVHGEAVTFPAFVERDAVEWGIGADYLIGGFLPLVELYQVILLHNDRKLLIDDVDTRLSANVRKLWMADRLEGQILAIWGIESGYELVRTQLTYALNDHLQLRGGILAIWGSRNSLIGEFKRNSEAFARIRLSF